MKSLKERIEIQQACLDGQPIEMLAEGCTRWRTLKSSEPAFLWNCNDYRIKKEPIVRWAVLTSDRTFYTSYWSESIAKEVVRGAPKNSPAYQGIVVKLVEELEDE